MTTITADRKALAEAVAFAAHALPRNAAHPALYGLKIDAGDELAVSAFDFDTFAGAKLDATVDTPATFLLPGRAFARMLAGATGTTATLTIGDRAELVCGAARASYPLLPLDQYPAAPTSPDELGIVDAEVLAHALSTVKDCADPTNGHIAARGIVWDFSDRLTVVASDRHQLGAHEVEWTGTKAEPILTPVAVAEAARGLSGQVHVLADSNVIGLYDGSRCTVMRLLADEPMRWRRPFEAHVSNQRLTVDREEMTDALKWLISGSDEKVKRIVLETGTESVNLRLVLSDSGQIGAETAITAKVEGDDIGPSGWQPAKILPGLAAFDSPEVVISLEGPMKACLITADAEPEHRSIVMPVKL